MPQLDDATVAGTRTPTFEPASFYVDTILRGSANLIPATTTYRSLLFTSPALTNRRGRLWAAFGSETLLSGRFVVGAPGVCSGGRGESQGDAG